ncbi:MAG: hypothetical protein QOH41_952 [Blastocatellia bacterium]|jgi:hypothetical protein|nr:hypothetical protein [Blastocatellia bacterium]
MRLLPPGMRISLESWTPVFIRLDTLSLIAHRILPLGLPTLDGNAMTRVKEPSRVTCYEVAADA